MGQAKSFVFEGEDRVLCQKNPVDYGVSTDCSLRDNFSSAAAPLPPYEDHWSPLLHKDVLMPVPNLLVLAAYRT